ncbi:MAG: glycosyltransferase [Methylacidiphilales bacterium]|nr:glycosyltransferase [Candidatus Methylacidiphilales bacterium]MDW8348796.1 glycosyltransferase [Verrucomicrobiae bacterium]
MKRYIYEKQRYIERETLDEHILIVPGDATRLEDHGRIKVFTVWSPRIDRTSRYRILLNTKVVKEYLREARPDIIEAGDPYHLAWTALEMGRELGVPVVGFYHSHFPEAYLRTLGKYIGKWAYRKLMRWCEQYIVRLYSQMDATFVPSDHLRQLLRRWGVRNAVTLQLGVDTQIFHPDAPDLIWKDQLGIPADAYVLLYVGRLAREKNIDTLLEAFEILCRDSDRLYWLVVVGDGPLRSLVKNYQEKTGQIVWRSYVNESNVLARYYRCADLFVHPGICETFGLVTLEAQACGCPVIGIRGSYMDANVFGGHEYWARNNSSHALADAIERIFNEDLAKIGAEAAREVHNKFSWDKVFSKLWRHYEIAIKERRGKDELL